MQLHILCTDGMTPVDLRQLAHVVQHAGGFTAVEQGGWGSVCSSMGVDPVAYPGAPRLARSAYVHLLLGAEVGGHLPGGSQPVGHLVLDSEVVVSDDDDPFSIE